MGIIESTRELGKVLQQEQAYKDFYVAKDNAEKDDELQDMLKCFNEKREEMTVEVSREEKEQDPFKINQINEEIKSLYKKITANQTMVSYETERRKIDTLMKQINKIIVGSLNGENPDEIDLDEGCSGDCSGCSSCN